MENQEIIKALIQFQSKCPKLELNAKVEVKTKTGGKYTFYYADLPYIMEMIQPILTDAKLAVFFIIGDGQITIHIAHESGQSISSSLPLQIGSNPQDNGSLITYYKRYLLTSILNIVSEQDDDANVTTGNDYKKTSSQPTKSWLNPKTVEWNNTTEKLKAGKVDLATVKKHYSISKENEQKLTDLIEEAKAQAYDVKNNQQ